MNNLIKVSPILRTRLVRMNTVATEVIVVGCDSDRVCQLVAHLDIQETKQLAERLEYLHSQMVQLANKAP